MKIIKKECTREVPKISLCTLGSINWGSFRHPEDMRRACRILHRSLNNILDYQDFLSIQSKLSNDEIRPLGVGITNLAYWHAKRGLKYGAADALAEVKSWQEHQSFYLTEMSVELARERGKCLASDKTRYGQGVFPWELRAKGVNDLTNFTPELDWEPLRAGMLTYGVRNATNGAVAPVESCQSWRNLINFADGSRKNFHQMLDAQGINWKEIESTCESGTSIELTVPIQVSGRHGVEHVTTVVYNGLNPVNTLEFEDGTVMNFTDNHRLLVNRAGTEEWSHVFELEDGDDIVHVEHKSMKIKSINKHSHEEQTWDVTTPSGSFLLPNGSVSHNSSVVINSTNGIEMPMSLISVKESKAGSFTQVVPEYQNAKVRKNYQLMWEQPDCEGYLKTAAVIAAYTDQSISTNTFYSPRHFPDRKVPVTLIAKNLMNYWYWGGKTVYYSLIEKQGSKAATDVTPDIPLEAIDFDDDADCSACKL